MSTREILINYFIPCHPKNRKIIAFRTLFSSSLCNSLSPSSTYFALDESTSSSRRAKWAWPLKYNKTSNTVEFTWYSEWVGNGNTILTDLLGKSTLAAYSLYSRNGTTGAPRGRSAWYALRDVCSSANASWNIVIYNGNCYCTPPFPINEFLCLSPCIQLPLSSQ